MDHISIDAAFRSHPTLPHPPVPARTGGYLFVRSALRWGNR